MFGRRGIPGDTERVGKSAGERFEQFEEPAVVRGAVGQKFAVIGEASDSPAAFSTRSGVAREAAVDQRRAPGIMMASLIRCRRDSDTSTVNGQPTEDASGCLGGDGKSVAELIRQGVDRYLAERSELRREERIEKATRLAGRFSSGRADAAPGMTSIWPRRSAGTTRITRRPRPPGGMASRRGASGDE